ncbi:MAG: thioredoxin family protein [Kiritimatiellae bacterium]|nr:thioredoxin family protein [Kiritimatiellia bacterium]
MNVAEGYMEAEQFLAFLSTGAAADPFAGMTLAAAFGAAILGGLAMNLTPCVLPMVPINLMVIGKSAWRGALYGLGITLAYGVMGLLAAFGGMAFGAIQSNPWFNVGIAALFVFLSLALMDVVFIDFSGRRGQVTQGARGRFGAGFFAFFMGAVSAVLAGACVAPILIAVLLLTARMTAEGSRLAVLLPFALGLGMALPWPFAGAGMQILPKPGAWMKKVNKAFGVLVLCFAAWYGYLAWLGFTRDSSSAVPAAATAQDRPAGEQSRDERGFAAIETTPATFPAALAAAKRPVLVDCWATWCKNCTAMERKTMRDPKVREELKRFTVIRLQADDVDEFLELEGFGEIKGLPAFVIIND